MLWRIGLIVVFLAVGTMLGIVEIDYQRFLVTPLGVANTTVHITKGSSVRQLAERLTAQSVLKHPYYFMLLAYWQGDQTHIKAGEFAVTADLTPQQLLKRFTDGQVIEYTITLIEGRTFRQTLAVLDAHPQLCGEPLAPQTDAALMTQLGRPELHPEGRFFPDTYRFPAQTERLTVLRRALERMERIVAEEWRDRSPDVPLTTPDEALILASIIEKETAVAAERPRISGVFLRRLQRGMRLQTDPTVIYGLGERYDGSLSRADLRDVNPYNTYLIKGLPPTPIALPGRAAIHAALHPTDDDSLYFVATGDGGHTFSRTLNAHQQAVRRYLLDKKP
ncbi:endolytic transglycosylase MltG [Chromatium okenii]|uniref:Endolytic murein transglycosylase n=1 Tax=Chromatium okenii TaxID=61644 RepID=A0A2S7XNU5_9GAMM|nr:endolytic transglycosylase MltG [Chromatium okenii]PQJ95108.1 endolytic transglycosylase MltG [Chromatium okenii]